MTNLYSTIDCALLLEIPEHRLNYAYRSGHLPKPKTQVAGRRVHTIADVRRVAKHFGVPVPKEAAAKGGRDE